MMCLSSRNELNALDGTTIEEVACCHLEFLSSLWISILTVEDDRESISISSLSLLLLPASAMLLLMAIRKRLLWCCCCSPLVGGPPPPPPGVVRAALLYVRITVFGESGSSRSSDIDLQWFIVYCGSLNHSWLEIVFCQARTQLSLISHVSSPICMSECSLLLFTYHLWTC